MSKKHEARENDDSPFYTAIIAAILASAVVSKQNAVSIDDAINAYGEMLQALRSKRDILNP